MERARAIDAAVGVRAEVVALGLEQVGRQPLAAVGVEVGQRGAEGRRRDAVSGRVTDHLAQRVLARLHSLAQVSVEQQIRQIGVTREGRSDLVEELRADDTTAAPDFGDFAMIQIVVVFLAGGAQHTKALSIRANLGGVHRLLHRIHKGIDVTVKSWRWPAEKLRRAHALVFVGRKHPRFHRRADHRRRRAQVERALRRPLTGAFVLRLVKDYIHEGLACLLIERSEDVAGDLDQVRLQVALVPAREDVVQLRRGQSQAAMQHIVSFGDELHIAVFDAVMHHLDEMPCALRPDVGDARTQRPVRFRHFSSNRLENRADQRPRLRIAAGHDRRAPQRAIFAAAHARPYVADAVGFQRRQTTLRITEVRVAAVDQQIAAIQRGLQPSNDGVNRLARRHHHQDFARPFQQAKEVAQDLVAHGFTISGHIQSQHLIGVQIVPGHSKTIARYVQRQHPAHYAQSNDTDICFLHNLLRSN